MVGDREFKVGNVIFDISQVDGNYATMLVTSLDDQEIEKSKRLLVLASSGASNTEMKWNEERNSVGDSWGHAPTLVNVVTGQVTLPMTGARIYALDGTGKRMGEVKTTEDGTATTFDIGPEHKTIWYEVVVE